MKAIFSVASAATALLPSAKAFTEVQPGVFSVPLKKKYSDQRRPHLQHGSPLVGNWEEAEMWNYEVKEPVYNLDNYLYAIDCDIGDTASAPTTEDYHNDFVCVFDTTTSISSTFA